MVLSPAVSKKPDISMDQSMDQSLDQSMDWSMDTLAGVSQFRHKTFLLFSVGKLY